MKSINPWMIEYICPLYVYIYSQQILKISYLCNHPPTYLPTDLSVSVLVCPTKMHPANPLTPLAIASTCAVGCSSCAWNGLMY